MEDGAAASAVEEGVRVVEEDGVVVVRQAEKMEVCLRSAEMDGLVGVEHHHGEVVLHQMEGGG